MNVSNTAYFLPLTDQSIGIQREGIDPSREIEDPWYAPIEKVTPRKYHTYTRASINEKLYGVEDEEESKDNENTEQPVVDPVEPKPETPVEPEPQPETPVEPENP